MYNSRPFDCVAGSLFAVANMIGQHMSLALAAVDDDARRSFVCELKIKKKFKKTKIYEIWSKWRTEAHILAEISLIRNLNAKVD